MRFTGKMLLAARNSAGDSDAVMAAKSELNSFFVRPFLRVQLCEFDANFFLPRLL